MELLCANLIDHEGSPRQAGHKSRFLTAAEGKERGGVGRKEREKEESLRLLGIILGDCQAGGCGERRVDLQHMVQRASAGGGRIKTPKAADPKELFIPPPADVH